MTSLPDDLPPFDVAILGGGAAGVLVAIHLLHADPRPLRIAIVEPRPEPAQGVAYSTAFPEHLLNVIASRMSAFDDDPQHLVRHLAAAAPDPEAAARTDLPQRFIPRRTFAAYLRDTLRSAPGADRIAWIRDEAVAIVRDGGWRIALRSEASLRARQVVLAIGNEPRAVPLPAAHGGGAATIDAWDYAAVRAIDPGADVCIIGSGLSMVDAVGSLAERGHRGRITVLSRHGLLPLPHAPPGSQHGDADALLALGMRARLRALRDRARAGVRDGQPWQWTMDAVRHHGQALWQASDASERRRFLRHGARFWDIHRHRIAPEVAARLDALRASGQLDVRAGRLLSIATHDGATTIRYRPRHGAHEATLSVGAVINATGIETALARSRRPLLRSLQAAGLAQPGPLGLGLGTDADGALLDAQGRAQPDLVTLGSLRIGELWETIAIPELRVQAQTLAGLLRQRIGSDRSASRSGTISK